MAVLGDTYLDLVDVYQREPTKMGMVPFINMLSYATPMLQDAIVNQCNRGTYNLTSLLTKLPTGAWGRYYKGNKPSKTNRVQVTDSVGFYESMSVVDTRILDDSPNGAKLRQDEAMGHMEHMSQQMATSIIYSNAEADPDQFMGLAPRFNDFNTAQGDQIINAGGAGSATTSIWLVSWGDLQTSLLYPANTTAGLSRKDHGEQQMTDPDGDTYFAKKESFRWHMGMSVRDWRYVVRIVNVPVAGLKDGTFDIYKFLSSAYYRHEGRWKKMGNTYLYCNSEVRQAMDDQAINRGAGDNFIRLKPGKDIQGKEVETYRGFPIQEVPSILNTETAIT